MNLNKTSKFIALILRHKPETIGISLNEHGWANVHELIDGINATGKHHIDMTSLEEIVRNDEKQRYLFNEDKSLIRANQGHSIDVNIAFQELPPPEILYHGTSSKNLDSIFQTGINKGNRLYVHLSKDIPTAEKVGARHGTPVILSVSSLAMYNDGYRFYLSDNGVWLTEFVPVKYISVSAYKP